MSEEGKLQIAIRIFLYAILLVQALWFVPFILIIEAVGKILDILIEGTAVLISFLITPNRFAS